MERRNEGLALRTTNSSDRIALRGVRVRSRLAGMSQRTVVEQTFVNLEPRAIEAVYTFPLPEGAAVCGFEVITGDRVLTGRVEETDAAIEQYDNAIADGDGAFMVEQERPDVFTARVGNLNPRQAATIRLTFVAPLEIADRSIRVAFPTTVAPRYASPDLADDPIGARIDADALNPPHVLSVPYGLTLEVEVALGRPIIAVTSPTHPIRVETAADEENARRVTLAGGIAEMNRDLVLSITTAREQQPCVQLAKGPDGADYVAVTFVPEFDPAELGEPRATETVFLLDCSGSMQGESIAQAAAALELCLRSLNPGDTFDLCRFGSTYEMMSSEPLRYDERTLGSAIAWVRASRDLGGTEIRAPLEAILARPPVVGDVRTVIVLTDGQVTNEPAVVDLARRHRQANRIFSFGIGSACSAFLVKGLARATGGAAEFISGAERIDEKVLRTFSRAASPAVTDVEIDWTGSDVQTLAELPPVFDGDVMTIFGRVAGRAPRSVSLKCRTPAGPRRWSLPVPPHAANDDGAIATMWARRTIQSLEEVNGVRRTSVSDRRESRARQELIRISRDFGLLCSLTTFIAVEHRSLEDRNEGRPELRRVPVQLANGWGGVEAGAGTGLHAMLAVGAGAVAAAAPAGASSHNILRRMARGVAKFKKGMAAAPAAPAPSHAAMPAPPAQLPRSMAPRRRDSGPSIDKTFDRPRASLKDSDIAGVPDALAESEVGAPPASAGPRHPLTNEQVMSLLATQTAVGAFAVSTSQLGALFQDAGAPYDEWRRAIARQLVRTPTDDEERIAATLLAVVLLTLAAADRKDLWCRAAQKSLRFVALSISVPIDRVEALIDELIED